jgi:integrase
MARPPLPIGTYGNIAVKAVPGGIRASTRFRDHDGVTRKVERFGPTEAAAKNRLREDLRDRGLDRVIQTVQLHKGSATVKIARTVISGGLGLAVRHRSTPSNPVRDIGRTASSPRRPPRALTTAERIEWISRLRADEDAVRKDLPDLCEWMLGTGVRIGEALAVSWHEVDLAAGVVAIEYTIIRITGVGLIRKGTKSSEPLPTWRKCWSARLRRGVTSDG